jgi:hypothetical protein
MATPPQVKALACPNCGAGVQVRTYARTLNVVCVSCLTVLDASTPELQILQKFEGATRIRPLVPLGKRGKLESEAWENIGFQVREIVVDGVPYQWHEYLLFNPYKGYRYLTEYDGHWNDVKTLKSIPSPCTVSGKPAVQVLGRTYRHFQSAEATTVYVMGEFPWQVRVGDQVRVADYVAPPFMVSSETTADEVTWSIGEYTDGRRIFQAFELQEAPPAPRGVYANQPSPYAGRTKRAWTTWLFLNILLFALMFFFSIFTGNQVVLDKSYYFTTASKGEASFVTDVFELKGRISNVELTTSTDLDNDWAYFGFALVNEATGQGYDFGREVSCYYGRDSDGSWSEGGRNDSVVIPSVPPGRYYLRVEPEMQSDASGGGSADHRMNYRLQLRRDVPYNAFFWFAALLLLVPPVFTSLRRAGFETRRWNESDYAGGSSGGSDSSSSDD